MVIGVLVELSNKNIDKVFDYNVPLEFRDLIKIGIRVLVPFGKQTLEGFVLSIKEKEDEEFQLRDILDVKDKEIVLNNELLELGKVMQEKTLATLISCYQVMLPKALKAKEGRNINIKYDTFYKLSTKDLSSLKFNSKQEEIINLVKSEGKVLRKRLQDISLSSLNTLIKNKALEPVEVEHYRVSYSEYDGFKYPLTNIQQEVVSKVLNNLNYNVSLLYGVTGSGKTEVYMEIIEHVLKLGKTSIVLVPEISLTPQMVNRFQKRFGNKIAALHSALSDGEKYDEWRRIVKKEASIVIGARSAIFAPLDNIGVIIIDEEHSESYKQSDLNPKYSAKDIAFLRGKYHNCPVILGSATPSLESMARAEKNVYNLLELSERVNGHQLPKINIVDMNENIRSLKGHFSKDLVNAINDRLEKNEQTILFLNRRGYSPTVSCRNCGNTIKCPNCDISLTYHKTSNTLRCHYCGYGTNLPLKCPECGEESLTTLGVGTEKIEEELHKIFPTARVLRMDFDTTSRKGMHEKMITAFKNHEYDILLGTQIVAKGLDFKEVTLVGVINADTSLNIPDFRSSENTFSLLSQVAGRSGRGEKQGEVYIQTFNKDHYAIKYASKHDYMGFYKKEMETRKILKYPPYFYLCYIKISGKDSNYIFNEACKIKRSLDRNLQYSNVLGPSQCSLFKINNIYKYGIIIKYKKDDMLYPVLEKINEHYRSNNKIRIDIDFNPSQIY